MDKELYKLLLQASNEMIRAGKTSIISEYSTCKNLGNAIKRYTDELQDNNQQNLRKLWGIFAPTCDWDDAGGSTHLGNKIFNLLGNYVHSQGQFNSDIRY